MFEQDRVILRLQQYVLREAAIRVCFLAGSHGRHTEDDYSDLDVALLFADESRRETAWKKRRELVQAVLPYVSSKSFDAEHIRPYFHIALYSNGAKVDYRYETQESLQPNPWDKDIRILKDSNGWGEQFLVASAQQVKEQPRLTTAELTDLDNRFWVMFWDVYRLLLRGDHDKPFPIYLELLHFTLPPLLQLLSPEDPARQDLLRSSFSQDTKATANQMAQLLKAYLAARERIIQKLHLDFSRHRQFETSIMRIVGRH